MTALVQRAEIEPIRAQAVARIVSSLRNAHDEVMQDSGSAVLVNLYDEGRPDDRRLGRLAVMLAPLFSLRVESRRRSSHPSDGWHVTQVQITRVRWDR